MENSSELIEQLNSQFPETMAIGLKNEMNYEDLRIALAQYLAILLKENKTLLYAQLYRIDVAEKDVKIALENKNSEYLLAEFILQKLNEKLYWRNKYKKAAVIRNVKGECSTLDAILVCLIISTSPVTEIKEVSFNVICQTLLKFGIASLNI